MILGRLPATLSVVLPAAFLSLLLGGAIGLLSTRPLGERR